MKDGRLPPAPSGGALMHFDDRLDTVLRQPDAGRALRRIQFRQLLDLLGTAPSGAGGTRLDAAHARLAELSQDIPAPERAAMLREPGLRLRNPQLLAMFMAGDPAVAAAAVAKAELSEEQWLDLVPALPVRLRGLVRQRRGLGAGTIALLDRLGVPARALPPADGESALASPSPALGTFDHEPIEEIGAIVRRIEAYRKTRPRQDSPDMPEDAPHAAAPADVFDFATDAEGRIVWADRACAPAAIGLRLAGRDAESPLQPEPALTDAFRDHQPIRGMLATIEGGPLLAGHWRVEAMPRFERAGGRFAGYFGRMRRTRDVPQAGASAASAQDEADRMRQMLHELRTPVNAIQGFAEVLLYQLYGPTPHEYRALAAAIAGDSARILAGFDELERLAKLECEALRLEHGESDLAALVTAALAQLTTATTGRGSGFMADIVEDKLPVALARVDAERLVWRLLATLANSTAPGEMLKLRLRGRDGEARMTVRLPASLAVLSDEALFRAGSPGQPQAQSAGLPSAGMFGAGFALRLAATEARAAGGALDRRGDKLRLTLPGLTAQAESHSQASAAPA